MSTFSKALLNLQCRDTGQDNLNFKKVLVKEEKNCFKNHSPTNYRPK